MDSVGEGMDIGGQFEGEGDGQFRGGDGHRGTV